MVRWTLPRGTMTRDRQVRLVGVALYAAIVGAAWWWQPEALPFVVPSAAFGMVMHAGMRRPWLGQAGFWVLLVVVPAVLFPSLLTEAFALNEGP
jgi:hypothetical protein